MTKTINASRITFVSVGILLAILFVVLAPMHKAHAALVLDTTTAGMLGNTLSGTRNVMSTVQTDMNVGMFTPVQSTAISEVLGGIGNTLATISSMIGNIGLPNTGELPEGSLGMAN